MTFFQRSGLLFWEASLVRLFRYMLFLARLLKIASNIYSMHVVLSMTLLSVISIIIYAAKCIFFRTHLIKEERATATQRFPLNFAMCEVKKLFYLHRETFINFPMCRIWKITLFWQPTPQAMISPSTAQRQL